MSFKEFINEKSETMVDLLKKAKAESIELKKNQKELDDNWEALGKNYSAELIKKREKLVKEQNDIISAIESKLYRK